MFLCPQSIVYAVFVDRFLGLFCMIGWVWGKWFKWFCLLFVCLKVSVLVDIFDIYVLNLVVTAGMFAVIIVRAWLELKNYKLIWRETEWQKNYDLMRKVLRAEHDMFSKVEGGEELYKILSEMFRVNEQEK
jgi:hypothetical protein